LELLENITTLFKNKRFGNFNGENLERARLMVFKNIVNTAS
jgi:hypothetical protein